MKYDDRREGASRYGRDNNRSNSRDYNRDMKGPARRTYGVRSEENSDAYRGNGYRSQNGRGNAPRVGAVYQNVPAAQRVQADEGENRRSQRDFERKPRYDRAPQRENRLYNEDLIPAQEGVAAEENENLLVGRNPIREALKAGRPVEKLLVAAGDLSGAARDIIRLARDNGAVVQTVDRSRLDQIYPAHQGMLAYVAAVDYKSLDDIFDYAAEKNQDPFIIVLDGVTDPHNLGAIIRSAECAGAHGVIVPERRAAGLGPAAAKAAAGALNYMRIARVKNLNRTIDELKERGVWVIGTAMDGENALAADLTGPVALVIGSEGEGISRLTLEKCDRTLTLPMQGSIVSLNASVAAGVLMYEIVRARAK